MFSFTFTTAEIYSFTFAASLMTTQAPAMMAGESVPPDNLYLGGQTLRPQKDKP